MLGVRDPQATRRRHRRANRQRDARFELVSVDRIDADFDLLRRLGELHHQGHFGGLSEHDQPARLFDPQLPSHADLPLGILSHKEEPLPVQLLPKTKQDLLRFCERLITVERDDHLVALVVGGWPGPPAPQLEAHVDQLWELRDRDRDLYRFVVCGQHQSARQRARCGLPAGWSWSTFDLVLARMALLWCAHDVQLSFARALRMVSNPFGLIKSERGCGTLPFLDSTYCVLTPSKVVEIAKPRYERLLELLSKRDLPETEQRRYLERTAAKDPHFRRALQEAERLYREGEAATLATAMERELRRIPALMQDGARQNPFWRGLVDPGARPKERSFMQACFSGLSLVQAEAVAILRFCQAEKQLLRLIARPGEAAFGQPSTSALLPPYRRNTLGSAGMKRAQNLLRAYRVRFRDKDFESCGKEKPSVLVPGELLNLGNVGLKAVRRAEEFLQSVGGRRLTDHEGSLESVRRTFYLLDVIPEARLCR